jgi:phosphatidylethanolamine/phosphatidyl-N-methylethanolamine N-methyltransferase
LKPQKRKLFQEINSLPFGQLLEIGVGNGKHFKQYTSHKVTGIDSSVKMLEIAEQYKTSNIQLLRMDGHSLKFKNESFDYVVLSHVIAVVDNPEKLLSEVYRVLKPGGSVFVLNHFTPDNWLKYIDRLFNFCSQFFHFHSVFYIGKFSAIKKFTLYKELRFGRFAYFKLLIYRKA